MYKESEKLLNRALESIPLGSQTFSKSHIQYPEGEAPLFIERGSGGRVWDVDGNEYVDLVCGLLPVVLGYCDPDVDEAIQAQLKNGITFSQPSPLEAELAERLIEIIPCAEMVRFGKNGTDATSAAIRLSRAYTGRDHVIALGYHGWQDWYIGATTRRRGVPKAVQKLTHKLPYNDLEKVIAVFEKYSNDVAAVILEPMSTEEPAPGYLEGLRELCDEKGSVLVFDEVITGFRFGIGGAQEYFNITPDLACFGKALGNGMPISAIVGRADIMYEMESVFFSGTFGGETLSIAAAIAVIDKMRREPVIENIWRTGQRISDGLHKLLNEHNLDSFIKQSGFAPWKVLSFVDHPSVEGAAIRTLLMKELLANGVLTQTAHNVCYAHNEQDIKLILDAYAKVLPKVEEEIMTGRLASRMGMPVIRPVFQVRTNS